MSENDTPEATPLENEANPPEEEADQPEEGAEDADDADAVELDIASKAEAIEFINHHVNVASNAEVAKNAAGEGFTGKASGFAGGPAFVPSTPQTGPSKAQAKADAAAKINAGASPVTLAKQADGTWTVT